MPHRVAPLLFEYAGHDRPGYGPAAVAGLERCAKAAAPAATTEKGR